MGELWLTAGLPAVVAVLTVLYTTGGRAALARRAIRQDLEIAEALPPGNAREAAQRVAEDKMLLYAGRWIGPPSLGLPTHLRFGVLAVIGAALTLVPVLVDYAGTGWFREVQALMTIFGLILATSAPTAWFVLRESADNGKTRARNVLVGRKAVEGYLRPPVNDGGTPPWSAPNRLSGPSHPRTVN